MKDKSFKNYLHYRGLIFSQVKVPEGYESEIFLELLTIVFLSCEAIVSNEFIIQAKKNIQKKFGKKSACISEQCYTDIMKSIEVHKIYSQ